MQAPCKRCVPAQVMRAVNYVPSYSRIVLALTSSFDLTPALWASNPRVVNTSVTIAAWPQARPVTLGMGRVLGAIAIP